jgi:hypothetical protein
MNDVITQNLIFFLEDLLIKTKEIQIHHVIGGGGHPVGNG